MIAEYLGSISDSDDEFDCFVVFVGQTQKGVKKPFYNKKQITVNSVCYFRSNRNQFGEILRSIRDTVYSFGGVTLKNQPILKENS